MQVLSINKFFYLYGGSERYMFALNDLLEKHGHAISHFAMHHEKNEYSPYSEFFAPKSDYFSDTSLIEKAESAARVIYSQTAKRNLSNLLKQHSPHVAHLHNIAHQLSPSILYALADKKIPIVQTLHDYKLICPTYTLYTNGQICERCISGTFIHASLQRCNRDSLLASLTNTVEMYLHRVLRSYDLVDVFISPSRFLRSKMLESGVDGDRIKHVPLFINSRDFQPNYQHDGYFLFMGQLIDVKGVDILLDAIALVPQARLVVAGRGTSEKSLQQKAVSLGIDVTFVGFQSGVALRKLVCEAMAVVVPSRWYENQPFAILEALAYGKPVIGSNLGGIAELVNEYEDGLLFQPEDASDLAARLEWILSNQDRLLVMGQAGRRKIEEEFSPAIHYQKIYEIYQNII